jgi:endonuclease/exonuclease/phosphatase family metal-dependent hydrolase
LRADCVRRAASNERWSGMKLDGIEGSFRMRRSVRWMIAVAVTAMCVWPSIPVNEAQAAAPQRLVPIMTQNMDEGTGFGPLLIAGSLPEFVAAVTATYQEVQASKPEERAAAVAHEIALARPTLVGLQEVALWRTGPLGSSNATSVQIDQLGSLMRALDAQGAHYAPLYVETNLDVGAPSTLGYQVRATDRNVVLARTDLSPSEFKVLRVKAGQFVNVLTVPSVVGPVSVPRSWIAVDAQIRGTVYRFITTHLDASDPSVQVAQGNELLQGPANTTLPVVIAGDLNSAASGGPDLTATYNNLRNAGFADAWTLANPSDPGFTWPLHAEDPYTFVLPPPLSERIDLVLVRNNIRVSAAGRVGFTPAALTRSGLWPSDHAGVP